jgi:hypothetical protein
MAKISETDWYNKWKGFFVEAIKEDSLKIEEFSKSLTEVKTKQPLGIKTKEDDVDHLIDKEFLKFEKNLKKQVADFKKKVKKVHES